MATITLGSNTYNLITMPSTPGLSDLSVTMEDHVAVVESPFVPSQAQTQIWPGADRWRFTVTVPKMTRSYAAPWKAFLAALQGRLNVFQIGDPLGAAPLGSLGGVPLVNGAGQTGNALITDGWTHSANGVLLYGDYIQIVSRLYMVTAAVNANSSGQATIPIWPTLRESPADNAALITSSCVGVFRLATNKRQWHTTNDQLSQISFDCTEVR